MYNNNLNEKSINHDTIVKNIFTGLGSAKSLHWKYILLSQIEKEKARKHRWELKMYAAIWARKWD